MIEITVKTLDSQNHSFSLDDDVTVRGFKEYIAESVAVPADSQRLIYCGRVLQDEKKLNDYNVNGKVIHLVQRAPPQPGQRENEGGQSQNTGQNTSHIHRTHYRIIRDPQNPHSGPNAQVHGNAMYLGAMTLPTEVVEGHGLPLPQLSNTLSNSRMLMAERMLTNANRILDRLDNPNSVGPDNSNERQNTSSVENSDVNMDTSQSESSQSGSAGPTFMSQEDAIEVDAELCQPVRSPPPVCRAPRELKRWETVLEYAARDMLNIIGCHDIPNRAEDDPEEVEVSTSNDTQSGTTSQQQPRINLLNDESSNSERPRTTPTLPRPPQMADLLQMLINTQDRLRPYLERYRILMATDPVLSATTEKEEELSVGRLGTGPDSVSANQRIVDEVSRILHYIAHANHALSDIIVDMGQAPPRNLSCRPIVIQQSAILQAGIPIQVEAHISVNDGNARANRTEENGSSQTSSEFPPEGTEFTETPAEERPQQQNSSSSSHQRFDHQQNSDQQQRAEQQQRTQTPFGNLLSSVFNLPSNVEVLMEVSPDSSMDLNSADDQGSNNVPNNNGSGANNIGRGASGMFPWGAPPTDFIRNLMHAVAGHIVQDPSGMTSNQSSNTVTMPHNQHTIGVTIDSNGQNSGQSTQARNNVGTHPTTSTQTRSTSRPHVFHSHGLGLGPVSDPFLPCNSHHLRRPSASSASTSRQNTASRNQSGSQAVASTSSTSSANSHSPSSLRFVNGDRFLDMLRRGLSNRRFAPNRDAFAYTLRNFVKILSDGKIEVKFSNEIPATVTSGLTLANLMEIPSTLVAKDNLVFDLTLLMARSVQMEDVVGLRFHQYEIFSSLRTPLREFIKEKTNSSGHSDQFVDLILNCLRPRLSKILLAERETSNRSTACFDIVNSVENVLRRHLIQLTKLFCNEDLSEATFVKKVKLVFIEMITQFCNVVRYLFAGDQSELSSVVENLMTDLAQDMHPSIARWVLTQLATKFCVLAVQVLRVPHDNIVPLLTRTSPDQCAVESCIADAANMSKAVESLESVDTNFPGHEILPPDWVPTIALDGARQRRLAPSMQAGGIPNFSDAYLGCLPCKRRKIIQQEKPQLLANPTSNHSTISASIERMVRESASRAGVAEVEGAAVAVASDRGVRNAFGDAIRDYVQPRRYEGPEFPNSVRFPNASKFFYEDTPPKE